MNAHTKKIIAPVIITIIMVIFYIIYFGFIISMLPFILKLVVGIIPLAISGTLIAVCIQRIKEIKGGQEDDLSKY